MKIITSFRHCGKSFLLSTLYKDVSFSIYVPIGIWVSIEDGIYIVIRITHFILRPRTTIAFIGRLFIYVKIVIWKLVLPVAYFFTQIFAQLDVVQPSFLKFRRAKFAGIDETNLVHGFILQDESWNIEDTPFKIT
ncbi:MAG: hypothetical protein E7070_05660 [Bacteroidales bacterium]|nr:hypothetical protein [Bacteroidales bacterium]